jgi:uncharacterized protein (DUF1800 family)
LWGNLAPQVAGLLSSDKVSKKKPEKREKEIFLQKKFLFLSERPRGRGPFREKTKIFLQKIFVFSLFKFF